MANTKVGTVTYFEKSSPILAIFRLMPEAGSQFPDYKPGQYIALRRGDCRLTKKVFKEDCSIEYVPVLDGQGNPKRGPVTHSYSIASAPFETKEKEFLEFYVVLELDSKGTPGRLTESMFRMDPKGDNRVIYFDKITGNFTLDKRAKGFRHVMFVGTGTGLAPFISMLKQSDFEAKRGKTDSAQYTLVHTNRTYEELDYFKELREMEKARRFDFVYVPSVSRPTSRDSEDPTLGTGRANNVLRHILGMPIKEEEDLEKARAQGGDIAKAQAALERTVKPSLAKQISRETLCRRIDPSNTVIMTCGNSSLMEDIKTIADVKGIRFEKEDW